MLKFANLSLAQKRFVVSVLETNPSYKKNPKITLKECASIYYALRGKRTGGKNEKIGYPNWLFNKNKVERGVYQLPIPTDAELSAYTQELASKLKPVTKAKAKIAKLAKAKTVKVTKTSAVKSTVKADEFEKSRLQRVIDESSVINEDEEDFNQILRENGIMLNAA